jgi:hypothetical protein
MQPELRNRNIYQGGYIFSGFNQLSMPHKVNSDKLHIKEKETIRDNSVYYKNCIQLVSNQFAQVCGILSLQR